MDTYLIDRRVGFYGGYDVNWLINFEHSAVGRL